MRPADPIWNSGPFRTSRRRELRSDHMTCHTSAAFRRARWERLPLSLQMHSSRFDSIGADGMNRPYKDFTSLG